MKLDNFLENIKKNIYLIIPIVCILFWALLYLILQDFLIHQGEFHGDFYLVYQAGRLVLNNPKDLYKVDYYPYLPVFATILAFTYCLLPFYISNYLFYVTSIIFGMIFVKLFNDILILKNLEKRFHRFIFLIIISNGWLIFRLFYLNQFKFIVAVLLFYVIKREIEYRKEEKRKNLKYYLINYGLFILATAFFVYLILFLLIYLFNDIKFKELLKVENFNKYLIIIGNFILQNFLLLIYPSLILDGIKLFYRTQHGSSYNQIIYYLRDFDLSNYIFLLYPIFILINLIIAILLTINKKILLEIKFSYLSLSFILFSSFGIRVFIILFPLVLLLYIPFLKMDKEGIDFIKANIIILLGLISVALIYFNPSLEEYLRIFPNLKASPLILILYFRSFILIGIFGGTLVILYLKKYLYKLDTVNHEKG
ncbi:MAG: hypothetical protein EU532_14075 [Promethearchaeota archaeon]|nr:MAG: hypothetical protein EU532_14075 [Candidatus Lokiarchaeota archaeon]